jgi:hypothetical protein
MYLTASGVNGSVPHFIEIQFLVLGLKHADRWAVNKQITTSILLYVHAILFVKRVHNKTTKT